MPQCIFSNVGGSWQDTFTVKFTGVTYSMEQRVGLRCLLIRAKDTEHKRPVNRWPVLGFKKFSLIYNDKKVDSDFVDTDLKYPKTYILTSQLSALRWSKGDLCAKFPQSCFHEVTVCILSSSITFSGSLQCWKAHVHGWSWSAWTAPSLV